MARRKYFWRRLVRRITPRRLRNWMRNPAASARFLRSAWRWQRSGAVSLDMGNGVVLRCHPESARTFQSFIDDPDSVAEYAEFRAAARTGMRLYDLGAHYGFFSLAALALGGPRTRVLAVEPSPRGVQVLAANLGLAGAPGRAHAINAAVGRHDGLLSMVTGGVASENYMFAAEENRPDAIRVRQYGLPGLECLSGWQPTHLKLDIEGFESDVLTSEENLIAFAGWRPILFLELHCDLIRSRGRQPEAVLVALATCGYRKLRWKGQITPAAQIVALPLARLVITPEVR